MARGGLSDFHFLKIFKATWAKFQDTPKEMPTLTVTGNGGLRRGPSPGVQIPHRPRTYLPTEWYLSWLWLHIYQVEGSGQKKKRRRDILLQVEVLPLENGGRMKHDNHRT